MKFFRYDIVVLFLVSIFLGALGARGAAYIADAYFKETITGLTGEYGEYDLLVQLSEENKDEALAALNEVAVNELLGAKLKQGPSLVQKVNVFVSLPQAMKKRETYENIDKLFSSVPGGAGVSIITEPRLNVRGLPQGLVEAYREKFSQIEAVDFAYKSGSGVGVAVSDARKLAAVSDAVLAELSEGRLLEISFPKGAEPENQSMAAEGLVRHLKSELNIESQYVSFDKNDDDAAKLYNVMGEVKNFLAAYQTKVFIESELDLKKGAEIILPTKGCALLKKGESRSGQAVASVEYLKKAGLYQAVLVLGDSMELMEGDGFLIDDDKIGERLGRITWHNPRQTLVEAAAGAGKVVGELPQLGKVSGEITAESLRLFDDYSAHRPHLNRALENMAAGERLLVGAAERLAVLPKDAAKEKLAAAIASLEKLKKNLRYLSLVSPAAADSLRTAENLIIELGALKNLVSDIGAFSGEADRAGAIMGYMRADIDRFSRLMESMERESLKAQLANLKKLATQLDEKESRDVIESLELLQGNLPLLRDDDMAGSLNIINKLLNGQAAQNKRIQLRLKKGFDKAELRPAIASFFKHDNFNLFEAELGIIEPNIYSQAYRLLGEVHSVLAGLTAMAATIVFLATDHTTIAAVLNRFGKRQNPAVRGLGVLYGAFSGALLLSAIYFLSGAAIPYMPFGAVAAIGAAFGTAFGALAEKFSPLDDDEILAAESLGLNFDAIMREIVIPSARLGILMRLNRRRQKFK